MAERGSTEALDAWVLEELALGPERSGILIVRAGAQGWYEENSKSQWRCVDRAIQRLRKAGKIRHIGGGRWEVVR